MIKRDYLIKYNVKTGEIITPGKIFFYDRDKNTQNIIIKTNIECEGTIKLNTSNGDENFTLEANKVAIDLYEVFLDLPVGSYNFELVYIEGDKVTTSNTKKFEVKANI